MSPRAIRLITFGLWLVLIAYCSGFFWHWYKTRPCADVDGKPVVIEGERACEVDHAP